MCEDSTPYMCGDIRIHIHDICLVYLQGEIEASTVEVRSPSDYAMCGMYLSVGQTYLFVGQYVYIIKSFVFDK